MNCLVARDFPGSKELALQIQDCQVRHLDEDGSLEFRVMMPVKASAVKYRVPAEGEAEDSDGVTIHFLIHVLDGVLDELEIYKEDNTPIIILPRIDAIRVFAPN